MKVTDAPAQAELPAALDVTATLGLAVESTAVVMELPFTDEAV